MSVQQHRLVSVCTKTERASRPIRKCVHPDSFSRTSYVSMDVVKDCKSPQATEATQLRGGGAPGNMRCFSANVVVPSARLGLGTRKGGFLFHIPPPSSWPHT